MVTSVMETTLSLGEWAVSNDRDAVLTCLGLGSCVAFIAYDPVARVGGMAHMVLPDSTQGRATARSEAKFVDVAVPLVMQELTALGALKARMQVSLVGGAAMLPVRSGMEQMNIGARNAAAAHAAVKAQGLRVRLEDLGGTQGRTVRLAVRTGEVTISTARTLRAEAA
ncbi:MAG: chemotaxis protein CheD [Dehalococcoidia bacterium]